ncbi:MAG: transglycosylase SLT domain-containing protein [Pseudomonadota bacterium]
MDFKPTPEHVALANRAHAEFGKVLPPELVLAIIAKESGGSFCAWNPEPKYRYLWDVRKNAAFRKLTDTEAAAKFPPKDFPCLAGDPDQEFWGQQASWGLCQIMGAVARELGYRRPYLAELVRDEWAAIYHAMKHLSHYLTRYGLERGISSYNHGPGWQGDPAQDVYCQTVLAYMKDLKVGP